MAARKKSKTDEVEIEAHRAGDTVYISWFSVPEHLRRSGLGTKAYKAWEKALPGWAKYVAIHAANDSNEFWESLGFEYRWDFGYRPDVTDDLYESSHAMIKGVRDVRTPETVSIDPDDVS